MSIFLSGGPILEPMIGMVCGTIFCIGILILSVIKFLKSEKFKMIKAQSKMGRNIDLLLLATAVSIIIFILWFILMFVFTGIAFGITKNT